LLKYLQLYICLIYIGIPPPHHSFKTVSDALNIKRPLRPKPIYSFFPIYSPFKLDDDSGFDLGEDNKISSLYIQNGALCFEMTSVLRPGRFLGSHYIAFSVPTRTFIVTLDRVKEGIRAARKTKKAAQMLLRQTKVNRKDKRRRRTNRSLSNITEVTTTAIEKKQQQIPTLQPPKTRGFFSRFVDGYLQVEREDAKKEQITGAIRDFFGRQGAKLSRADD
jgi:ZipA, C-terminal FtsZ-binding domain